MNLVQQHNFERLLKLFVAPLEKAFLAANGARQYYLRFGNRQQSLRRQNHNRRRRRRQPYLPPPPPHFLLPPPPKVLLPHTFAWCELSPSSKELEAAERVGKGGGNGWDGLAEREDCEQHHSEENTHRQTPRGFLRLSSITNR